MCTVLLPPGDNPIAVNKYIYIYFILLYVSSAWNILGCFSYKGNTVEGGDRELTILLTINCNEGSVIMYNNTKEVAELSPETSYRPI